MPVVGPVLVADTTNTSGTGSLTLNNASENGRRGLADAVTNGDASNGDTVHYVILSTSASGASLVFEKGVGTISDAGATLSRDTVHQSSNAGSKVSLPGGGTYDVLIAVGVEDLLVAANDLSDVDSVPTARTNLGVPALAEKNTFTANQSLVKAQPRLLVYDTGSSAFGGLHCAVDDWIAFMINVDWAGTGNEYNLDDNSLPGWLVKLDPRSGRDEMVVERAPAGANPQSAVDLLTLTSAGVLQDSSGNAYDAFPSGTRMLFGGTIPTGWTRDNANKARVIRLARSGETIGATGGVETIFSVSWSTLGHTLLESQIPSHVHPVTASLTGVPNGSDKNVMINLTGANDVSDTDAAGGGGSHSHNMSTPYYEIAAWATKD